MTKISDLHRKWMDDPKYRREYEALEAEFTLSDEQLAEVRRRRNDPKRKLVSHAAARKRIKRLGRNGR